MPEPLQLPYILNILILVPIAVPTLLGLFDTAQGAFEESAGWRVLVGSLWTAILVGSILGLFAPVTYAPLLLMQVIYKSLWLAIYAAPRIAAGRSDAVPPGIAVSFVVIVLTYPFVIPWSHLLS
jgi:hypothetical protein